MLNQGFSAPLSADEKRSILDRVWRLEETEEVPFAVEIGTFHGATAEFFGDPAAEARWSDDFHRQREGVYDYGLPNIKPNVGIGIIAAAFGCEYTVNNEADPWIKSIISEDNVDDVHKLAVPDPETNPVFQMVWKRLAALMELSPLPLRMANVPSPLVTASMIWDYTSFIEGLLVFPDEVHVLMEKVTEATIIYIREQFKRIKNLYSVGHESIVPIPRSVGVRLSDDTAALLSPDLYREFGVKYLNKISREFGGVVVHSCGDVQYVVPAMMEIEGLRGLDFTMPQVMNWEAVRDAAAGKTVLSLRQRHWDHPVIANPADPGSGKTAVDIVEYAGKLIDTFGRRGIIIESSAPSSQEARELGEKLHRLLSK